MNTPTKPIERVYIHAPGDRSTGIQSGDFTATVYIDPSCYANPAEELESVRKSVKAFYDGFTGDNTTVLFDFEAEKIAQDTARMEAEQLSSERTLPKTPSALATRIVEAMDKGARLHHWPERIQVKILNAELIDRELAKEPKPKFLDMVETIVYEVKQWLPWEEDRGGGYTSRNEKLSPQTRTRLAFLEDMLKKAEKL
jgi:hypothetical protein